jgi:nucleoside-diphosphate-sugar epimerase
VDDVRIFVAGASGVIGQPLLGLLLEAGHEVTAMTRSKKHAEELDRAGAKAVVVNAFDSKGVKSAVAAAGPEVVVHQLTSIPRSLNPRKYGQLMATNDRLRIDGTRNLVEAALAAGARRMLAQSVAFAYAPTGSGLKREEDDLFIEGPFPFRRSVEALAFLEREVTQTEGLEGAVLRYGFFYGPGTTYAPDGDWAARVRKRQLPIAGGGGGVFSFIEVGDAAAATVAALGGPPGVYNVVDDEPAPIAEWLPYYAEVLGAKPPRRIPRWLARLAAGEFVAYSMTKLRGASNQKARRELGWKPRFPSWRQGFRQALG